MSAESVFAQQCLHRFSARSNNSSTLDCDNDFYGAVLCASCSSLNSSIAECLILASELQLDCGISSSSLLIFKVQRNFASVHHFETIYDAPQTSKPVPLNVRYFVSLLTHLPRWSLHHFLCGALLGLSSTSQSKRQLT